MVEEMPRFGDVSRSKGWVRWCLSKGKWMVLRIRTILGQNLRQSAEKIGILDEFYIYQDNDPKHKARDNARVAFI